MVDDLPRKGRLVRISGSMLGATIRENDTYRAQVIQESSLICVDVSTSDPYPNAPTRVWHPRFGKMWYIDDGYSEYEWLDQVGNPLTELINSNLQREDSGSVRHSSR